MSKKKIIKKKIVLDSDDDQSSNKTEEEITVIKKRKREETVFDKKIEEIREALRENYLQQKKLMNDLRELMVLHKKEIKLSSKTCKQSNSGKYSGFNKPQPVPSSLKKLLKINEDTLPRSKVTALMYKYFTDNKMYNNKTKKEIYPNQKIKEIFGMEDGDIINFYNLQTWLKKVYNENCSNKLNLKQ